MDEVSKLIGQRNTMLFWAGISFAVWQGGQLADEIVRVRGWGTETMDVAIAIAILAGALGWVAAMIMMLNYASKLGRSRKQSVIQDEAYCQDQAKAFRLGYLTLLVMISALTVADLLIDFTASIAIRILMMVGISVPVLVFASINRADVEETA